MLWRLQGGICFYCGRDTVLRQVNMTDKQHMQRLGLTHKFELERRLASIEHLQRRADGGSNDLENLVMACRECNTGRMETPVLLHLAERRSSANQA